MLKPGDTFERYTIDSLLGQGGMGSVYRARDTRLERSVALKVISETAAGAEATTRLLREARAAAALDHPNAVAIFDVGETGGEPYIVMELVEGATLRTSVGDAAAAMDTRIGWLVSAGSALGAAHKKGLVHRDVKPENVMVRADGVVKVLDFGIARRSSADVDPNAPTSQALPTLTKEGVRLGTPLYMAPEQIRGDALDGRTDQFAWGVTAYELLAGRLPWRGGADGLAVAASILTDEPPEAPLDEAGVSTEVKAVIRRALAKRPADRFASMDEAVAALQAALRGEAPKPATSAPVKAPPVQSATEARRYSADEVRAILARAVDRQAEPSTESLGFDDLLAAAGEVGVDADVVRKASRELRLRQEERDSLAGDRADAQAWIRRKHREFYMHLGSYLLVNAAFLILGLMTRAFPWTMIPGLFWAIGLGMHALKAFMVNEDDWKESRDRRLRWEMKQRRREERMEAMGRAVGQRVDRLLDVAKTAAKRADTPRVLLEKSRVPAAPAEALREKIRIASTDAEAEAEADAHDEAAAERRKNRR